MPCDEQMLTGVDLFAHLTDADRQSLAAVIDRRRTGSVSNPRSTRAAPVGSATTQR